MRPQVPRPSRDQVVQVDVAPGRWKRVPEWLFGELFERAASGFAITSPDGVLQRVNGTFAQMLGRPVDELHGRQVAELVHPDDRTHSRDFIAAALAGEIDHGAFEKRFVRPDGTIVTAWLSSALIRDADGEPVCFTTQIVDLAATKAAETQALLARERQRLILRDLPGTLIAVYDPELRVVDVDGLQADPAGLSAEGVRGRHVSEFFTADAYVPVGALLQSVLAGAAGSLEVQTDEDRYFHVEASPFLEGGQVSGVVTVWHDVTIRRRDEQARRDADRQFVTLFEDAPIGMVLVELDGTFKRANAAICALTGYDHDALRTLPPFAFVHPDDGPAVHEAFAAVGVSSDSASFEHRIVRADGELRWVHAQVTLLRGADDTPQHVLAQILDITDRKRSESMWITRATHDPLTGLLNRSRFQEDLVGHLARCRRYGPTGSVLFLDIDEFKAINDTHGHQVGDLVIQEVARTLALNLRSSDVLCRLGGDEFAVLLPAADRQHAESGARKLALEIDRLKVTVLDTTVSVTTSIGIRVLDDPIPISPDDALRDADRAMYTAKGQAAQRWATYTPLRH